MTDQTITSNAYNTGDYISSGVDVRTGSYSLGITLGRTNFHKASSSAFDLQLAHSDASKVNSGFGPGWSVSVSRYFSEDNNSGTLNLSTGQSFRIEWNDALKEYDIPYLKLKDIRVFYIDKTDEIKVVYKDGREDYLDWNSGLLMRSVSSQGLEIFFDYSSHNLNVMSLWRISDSGHAEENEGKGTEFIIDWWDSNENKTSVKHKVDGELFREVICDWDLVEGLTSVTFPEQDSSLEIKYRHIEACGYQVIRQVVYPSGLMEEVTYTSEGHRLPGGAPFEYLPRVKDFTRSPGDGQDKQYITYDYTQPDGSARSYLGYSSGIGWKSGEDTLFKQESDYRYEVKEIINGTKSVRRQYNKYHLMELAEYYDGDYLYRVEDNVYFADLDVSIEHQPSKYSLIQEQKVISHRNGESNSASTVYDYDDYGNQTLEVTPDGSRTESIYYPASGDGNNCPADPNGMVYLLKQETFIPNPITRSSPRSTIMTYVAWTRLDDSSRSFALLHTQETETHKQTFDYISDISSPLEHGRVKTEIMTINGVDTLTTYDYEFLDKNLKTTLTINTFDGLVTSSSESVDYIYGQMTESVSPTGICNLTEYDSSGRTIRAVVAAGSDYQAQKYWQYHVGDGINAITETDSLGNVLITRLNNAGNIIAKEVALNYTTPKRIQDCQYDAFGMLVFQTDSDWVDGQRVSVTAEYSYDENGNVKEVRHADGRIEQVDNDPVNLTSTTRLVGLMSETTFFDIAGQTIRKETRNSLDDLLAKTEYRYDGYGNLINTIDTDGHVTTYQYDVFDRVVKTTRRIDGQAIIEGMEYPIFSDTEQASRVSVNEVEMGRREYDGLLRLQEEHAAGATRSFNYTGSSPFADNMITPRGDRLNMVYNPFLQVPENTSILGDNALTSLYEYDSYTGLPLREFNANSERVLQRDNLGQVTTETVHLNDGSERVASYDYTLLGSPTKVVDLFGNRTEWSYDDYFRPQFITHTLHSGKKTITEIEYDEHSRPWRYTSTQDGEETVVELGISDIGLEESRLITVGGVEIFRSSQEYTLSQQVERRIYTDNSGTTTEEYTYDDLYRLSTYVCNGPKQPDDGYGNIISSQEFSHDIFGNITEVISTFDDSRENIATFTYDESNPVRMVVMENTHTSYPSKISFQYDEAGNLLFDENDLEYQYNALGQVSAVVDQGRQISKYAYNAQNQLVSQTAGGSPVYLYYQGDKLANESSENIDTCYHRASPGFTQRSVTSSSESCEQILLANSQGSIVTSLTKSQDQKEREREDRQYTPYGEG
ncbi:RHS repeat protein [Vibrio sp. AND4]|uniref:RHS repeat protein n=1 Tax=Vibrio sp. AND4 TaxID=314289 RepID=UPI00015F340A|nr:RHS repeat protein [Vibrio sp. AND4]EDP59725.1 hypothetical protein AND4_11224 [Vibrio sp. AND4]